MRTSTKRQKYQREFTELRNTITEVTNTPDRLNSRPDEEEERISKLEDKALECTLSKQQKEKRMKKSEDRLKDLQNSIKQTNAHILGFPKGKERKRHKTFFEKIMPENSPNLEKGTDIQIQESQRVPKKMNPKRSTRRHI